MYATTATLLDRMERARLSDFGVISWGAPVPSFGDLDTAQIATVGLNPSNREFVDSAGRELTGASRRFHTLRSLNLSSWLEVESRHLGLILDSCRRYFFSNPYDGWFTKLEKLLSKTPASFYSAGIGACHLDLIPYATMRKWTDLETGERDALLRVAGDALGLLLSQSSISVLVLNGRSVVRGFEALAGTSLDTLEVDSWTLPRQSGNGVTGVAFTGEVREMGSVVLPRPIKVLGYNHNIQSSFGVTSEVVENIGDWIAEESLGAWH